MHGPMNVKFPKPLGFCMDRNAYPFGEFGDRCIPLSEVR